MQRLHIFLFTLFCSVSTLVDAQTTYGCNDPDACNYTSGGFTVNSGCKYAGDVCDDGDVSTFASHYDATCQCQESIVGCMEPTACNYNSQATLPSLCTFENESSGCWKCSQEIGVSPHGDGNGVLDDNDMNDNGVCDEDEIYGCTDAGACNYNPNATALYAFDGMENPCLYLVNAACDYCGVVNDDGSITFEYDASNNVLSTHPNYSVIEGDEDGNGVCDIDDVFGCTDETACNYNPSATRDTSVVNPVCISPGVCGCSGGLALELPAGDCDCNGSVLDSLQQCLSPSDAEFCTSDSNENGICDDLEVLGCMNETACNYNELANVDDGSCGELDECGQCAGTGVPAGFCDCAGTEPDTNNNGLCDSSEITGCTDGTSCTYNADATFSVPSDCLYLDECNVCGGSGITDPSHCNCDGDVLDALGNCGGGCSADVDGDGICDNVDPCLTPGEEPDECGVCGGPGAIYECGCEPLLDRACSCDPATGEQFVPDPGKDCDGNCLNGQDENNQCIVTSSEIVTELTSPLMARVEGNRIVKELNPFDMERWLDRVDTLHARMSKNLDDGSLLGKSDSLTIEHQILNKGKLYVQDESVFSDFVRMDSNVTIGGNLLVEGWARIKGTTFSDGGLETTTLDMTGDLNVGGAVYFDSTLSVTQDVNFEEDLMVSNSIVIGDNNAVKMQSNGKVEADDAMVRDSLEVIGKTIMSDVLRANGGISVQQSKFTVNTDGLATAVNLQVDESIDAGGNLEVDGIAVFNQYAIVKDTLTIEGDLHHKGSTFSSLASTALIGPHAADISIKHRGGTLGVWGGVTDTSDKNEYSLVVSGSGAGNTDGIAIQVSNSSPGNSSDFITFVDRDGYVVGAIEGEQSSEVMENPAYTSVLASGAGDVIAAGLALGGIYYDLAYTVKEVAAAAAKGISEAVPGAGLTDSDVAEPVVEAIKGGVRGGFIGVCKANLLVAKLKLGFFTAAAAGSQAAYFKRIGVAYKSGGADYAEWIEKRNHRDDFLPGQVVGVREGLLTLNTEQSDHNMVISTSPIVLGNEPGKLDEGKFEKVAFMGQVPVRVNGPVKSGDYLVPSGENDGLAIAVNPESIRLNQIAQIIGVSWENGSNEVFNIVNASMGIDNNGMDNLVAQVETRLEQLELALLGHAGVYAQSAHGETLRNRWSLRKERNRLVRKTGKAESDMPHAGSLMKPEPTTHSSSSGTSTAMSMEELQQIIEEQVAQYLDEEQDVSPEVYLETIHAFESEMVSGSQQVISHLDDGATVDEAFLAMLETNKIPESIVKADAQISMAVFDYFVNEDVFKADLQNQLRKIHDTEMIDWYLTNYPPGSEAESAFINEIISEAEKVLYQAAPSTAIYCRGRTK